MTNQYQSIKRFQNIHSFFKFLFVFWIVFTLLLFPIARFSPGTFSFATPLELKESVNLANPESGELIQLKGLEGKIVFEGFKKDVLPRKYYFKVGIMFLASLFFVFIFYHLKGISQSILDKKPFHRQNQKRLKYIGITLVVLAFLLPMLKAIYDYHLPVNIECLAIKTSNKINILGINWTYLIIGLGVLFLGEVFKAGNELKQETDLTI